MVMYKLSDEGSRTGDACDASCSYKSQNVEKTVKKNKKKKKNRKKKNISCCGKATGQF